MSSALTTNFESEARSAHEWNWETLQPLNFEAVEDYVRLAEKLAPHLDAYTTFLGDKLGLTVEVMPASVKARDSALRKLKDTSIVFNPARMQDYLRTTIVVPDTGKLSIRDLSSVIDFIRTDANTIGYKDEYAAPNSDTGYRSFKAHVLIQNPDNPDEEMSAEIIIQHKGMLEANLQTAGLRTMERRFEEVTSGETVLKRDLKRESVALAGLKFARKVIHDIAAEKSGLNSLVDQQINYHSDLDGEADLLSRMQGTFTGVQARALTAVARILH